MNGFVVAIGMDVTAETLLTGLAFTLLEERGAGEANHHHILTHDMAHGLVQDAALGTVALIHKDVDVAFGLEVRRK